MGHTQVRDTNNALHGHKTEIKSKLADGKLPKWLHKDRYCLPSKWVDLPLSEILDKAAERARENRERYTENYESYTQKERTKLNIENPEDRTFTHTVQFSFKNKNGYTRSKVPQSISEKLNITTEEAQERTGFHHITPRDYRLEVSVGVRGGIDDIHVVRDFHH